MARKINAIQAIVVITIILFTTAKTNAQDRPERPCDGYLHNRTEGHRRVDRLFSTEVVRKSWTFHGTEYTIVYDSATGKYTYIIQGETGIIQRREIDYKEANWLMGCQLRDLRSGDNGHGV